jgi:FKBP-type peptidyl-prolyl cis-trans isomerase (trigger factor)
MPDTKEEIEQRMEELAREYGRTPPEDQRRSEIFKELVGLCDRLARLFN